MLPAATRWVDIVLPSLRRNKVLHLFGGRPGPSGGDGENLDGEGRIFGAAELQVGDDAHENDENQDRNPREACPLAALGTDFVGDAMIQRATETLRPSLRFAGGASTRMSPSFSPCLTSTPASTSRPRTMGTRRARPPRTAHT